MNKRGRTSAFVMGLISGIINIFMGIIMLLSFLTLDSFTSHSLFGLAGFDSNMAVIGVLFYLVTVLNLIGGCICRKKRVFGGVLMLITALPLLVLSIVSLSASSLYGAPTVLLLILLVELLSLISAIISFVPRNESKYGRPYQKPYQRQTYQQQFQQQPYHDQQIEPWNKL